MGQAEQDPDLPRLASSVLGKVQNILVKKVILKLLRFFVDAAGIVLHDLFSIKSFENRRNIYVK